MRVFWERIGVLGPVYRLVGQGFSDRDIADRLNITESKVHGCISWLLRFLRMANRTELVRDASSAAQPKLSALAAPAKPVQA